MSLKSRTNFTWQNDLETFTTSKVNDRLLQSLYKEYQPRVPQCQVQLHSDKLTTTTN